MVRGRGYGKPNYPAHNSDEDGCGYPTFGEHAACTSAKREPEIHLGRRQRLHLAGAALSPRRIAHASTGVPRSFAWQGVKRHGLVDLVHARRLTSTQNLHDRIRQA